MESDKNTRAFLAIKSFVKELWSVFGDKTKLSLALYNRLVDTIKIEDAELVNKAVSGFSSFLNSNKQAILQKKLDSIPKGTLIYYGNSEKVYIEIQKFIYKSDQETKDAILSHLLAINSILNPDDKADASSPPSSLANELGIDNSTPEGEFLGNILSKSGELSGAFNTDNPMAIAASMASSPVFKDMFQTLKSGKVGGKQLNQKKMMKMMQNMMNKFVDSIPDAEETEQKDVD